MPTLNARKCKPGDVILFYGANIVAAGQGTAKTLKVLTVLPALISAAQGGTTAFAGSSTANHAAIITQISSPQTFNMAHATSAGAVTSDVDNYLLSLTGGCKVFRMKGQFDFPAEAAEVGRTWSRGVGEGEASGIVYPTGKAILSALHSSSFGSGAKQRAAFYRQDRRKVGGPADFANMLEGRSKAMFCSMLVIACYQAVMSDMYCGQMLALDARNTSPMYLDGYLKGSQHWEEVNAV